MYILSTTMVLGLLIALLPEFSDRLFKRGKFGTVHGFRAALASSDRTRKVFLGVVALCWWTLFMLELAAKIPSVGCSLSAFLLSLTMLKHDVHSAIVCLMNDRSTKIWWAAMGIFSVAFCFVPGWNLMAMWGGIMLLTAWFYPNTEQIWAIKLSALRHNDSDDCNLKVQLGEGNF